MTKRPAILIDHPIFSTPAFGQNHPLSIMRHSAFVQLCQSLDWPAQHVRQAPLALRETLLRFHTNDYVCALEEAVHDMRVSQQTRIKYNIGTAECPIFEGLWERACASVGGSVLAAELALQGYLPFHPAGGTHHGKPDRASGFCYFNDPVFAILRLLDAGKQRILYIDLDAHHGDGVEAAFPNHDHVYLVSLHEEGRWPGTGILSAAASEHIINIPLPRGINDAEFLTIFEKLYRLRLTDLHPDAVVMTCGADALAGDPLSSMNISNRAMSCVIGKCIELSSVCVVLGGGGYNPWTTARFWCALWAQLNEFEVPEHLPLDARNVLNSLSCDLIDPDDMDPAWLTSLIDQSREGPVRETCLIRTEMACGFIR